MEQINMFFTNNWLAFSLLIIWTTFWKGCSLWIAAKNNHKKWFIALLVLNTFGILEIVYVFFISKKKWSDIKEILSDILKK